MQRPVSRESLVQALGEDRRLRSENGQQAPAREVAAAAPSESPSELHVKSSLEQGTQLPLLHVTERIPVQRREGTLTVAHVMPGTIMWSCSALAPAGPGLEGGLFLSSLEGAMAMCPASLAPSIAEGEATLQAYEVIEDLYFIDLNDKTSKATMKTLSSMMVPDTSAGVAIVIAAGVASVASFIGSPLFLTILLPVAAAAHVSARRSQEMHMQDVLEKHLTVNTAGSAAAVEEAGSEEDHDEEVLKARKTLAVLNGPEGAQAINRDIQAAGRDTLQRSTDALIAKLSCEVPKTFQADGYMRSSRLPSVFGASSEKAILDEVFVCPAVASNGEFLRPLNMKDVPARTRELVETRIESILKRGDAQKK
jgi:hypothetical protein